MAARCPHHRSECHDPGSEHCFYVKDTTYTALVNLHNLRGVMRNLPGQDPRLQHRIDELGKFLNDSRVML
jgi:hypothetical protein